MRQLRSLATEFVFWFGTGLAAFALSFTFNDVIPLYRYGANTWPAIIACLLMVCIALHCGYRALVRPQPEEERQEAALPGNIRTVFVIPVCYVLALPYAGFYAATLVFVPLYAWRIGQCGLGKTLLACIPAVCVIITLFTKFLFVPFPTGTLPFLYEFNSFIVTLLY